MACVFILMDCNVLPLLSLMLCKYVHVSCHRVNTTSPLVQVYMGIFYISHAKSCFTTHIHVNTNLVMLIITIYQRKYSQDIATSAEGNHRSTCISDSHTVS